MTILRDLFAVGGLIAIVIGLYLAWPPLAWIVAGGMVVWGAWLSYRTQQKHNHGE